MNFLSYQVIPIHYYIILSATIFIIGVCGIFLNRNNIISFLMSIELMLLAVNINFISFSSYLNNLIGQVFAIFVLTVAAAEIAVGLAILIVYFKQKANIAVEEMDVMKG